MTGPGGWALVVAGCLWFGALGCLGSAQQKSTGSSDPLSDTTAQELFEQGQAYASVGDLTRAEQYLVAAVERGFPAQEALPIIIDVCLRSNRYGLALKHARPQLAKDPANWRLRFVVATLHDALDNEEEAERELRRVSQDAPDAENVHYALARLLWERDAKDESRERFARYLELAPDGKHAVEARAILRGDEVTIKRVQQEAEHHRPIEVSPDQLQGEKPERITEVEQ